MFVSMLLSIFPFHISIYSLGLILKGICDATFYQSAFAIGIEMLGGKWRSWLGNFYSTVFALGEIYACLMADAFRGWKMTEVSLLFPMVPMLAYPL